MPRRTKEDAQATRESILDAAELLFEKQGVSRTTLQHIASAAGVTRGAIYWHFDDKAALFNAMLERVTMPLEAAMEAEDSIDPADPVADLRCLILAVFRMVEEDAQARRVFEIVTHKVEYVDELLCAKQRHIDSFGRWVERAERRIRLGVKGGVLKADPAPRQTALALWASMDGLIRFWLLHPGSFDLMKTGRRIIDAQFDALYVEPPQRKGKAARQPQR